MGKLALFGAPKARASGMFHKTEARKGPHGWILALALALVASPAFCGPLLDEILNCMQLDAHTGARDDARHVTVEPQAPVGQTFTFVGEVSRVYRIAIWQAFWHETWQPDEQLVMTLWDSPEKHTSYGRCAIPYARRMWEGAIPMFHLDAVVEPNREYYFELTVEVEPLRPAETPREWLLSGKRPGFAGGDGRLEGIGIARDDYPGGRAFRGGQPQDYDLWFEVHVKRPAEREALYQEAFGRLDLSYPPLRGVAEAVGRRDWEAAVDALIAHFEGRADLMAEGHEPKLDPAYDTRLADLAADHKAVLDDGTTVDLGPRWNHYTLWPERGGVGLTRSGLRKWLAAGYSATGNEKYARAFNDMLTCLFADCPSPLRAGAYPSAGAINAALPPGIYGGSMWSALSIGARMGHGFYYYSQFRGSPYFTRDVRAAFIINLGEMAEVLERMRGGGNWEAQMAEALFDFGLTYPEFKRAKAWVQQGFDTLVSNALGCVRPDGVLQEPSIGYHMLVANRYSSVMERVGPLGLTMPPQVADLTERMFNYIMYSVLPDGTLPVWGDANHPMTPDLLERGARLFGREDMRFVFTRGHHGTPPALTSVGFPHGGYYYMRTGWQPDAHCMAIHCGPYGSHGHRDTLSFVLCAFGRTLLIDPGVSTYGTPEARELSATVSHNTVTVDGRDAGPGKVDRWVTSEHFDYLAGHNEGYRGIAEVQHFRQVWFLKPVEEHPALWVVFDDVKGEGEHEAQLRFRFAPVDVHQEPDGLGLRTSGAGGNLLLRALGSPAPRLELGQAIAVWHNLTQVPAACFALRGDLPLSLTTALVPFRDEDAPPCEARLLAVTDGGRGARAAWVELGGRAVLVAYAPSGVAAVQVTLPDGRGLVVEGEGAAIRFRRAQGLWCPAMVHGVRLRRVTLAEEDLVLAGEAEEVTDLTLGEQ